jgi:hypothetical protein
VTTARRLADIGEGLAEVGVVVYGRRSVDLLDRRVVGSLLASDLVAEVAN